MLLPKLCRRWHTILEERSVLAKLSLQLVRLRTGERSRRLLRLHELKAEDVRGRRGMVLLLFLLGSVVLIDE